ncbi:lysophospholipase [Rhodothalassium salexigens DSM 2132]|uniref:Lysophospholipase n=1 Tax=Rhodothalassium salexigens DSM 2132 TaxID=1188247 RepID=A0A4R2PIR4_RHOSA|nr:alpha/beta hydrolase [Rhodothalassium salexigens]MBB4211459.1 lysophospholipase [Rhodothalassium salexigens DSM 2132]MBK1639396.1 hypothetical protein [Rhodothalassium salexigens DSM 2132]TCP35379.1 lysophospholipase [Rhodothalassium salexigens DSM 2132]
MSNCAVFDAPVPYVPLDAERTGWLTAGDGAQLRYARFGARAPRGTLVLLTGRTEYIEKYADVIAAWGERGFTVYAFDWRNQGLSTRPLDDPHKHHLASVDTLVDDLDRLMARIDADAAAADPGRVPAPRLAFAHSMGGHVLLRWLAAGNRLGRLDGAILSAPMVDIRYGLPKGLVRAIVGVAGRLGLGARYAPGQGPADPQDRRAPRAAAALTHDTADLDAEAAFLDAHPAYALGGVTIGWLRAVLASTDRLMAPGGVSAIHLPVLGLLGAEERVVDNRAAERLIRRLADHRLVTIAGARHEIWRELPPVRARMWAAIDEFLSDRAL